MNSELNRVVKMGNSQAANTKHEDIRSLIPIIVRRKKATKHYEMGNLDEVAFSAIHNESTRMLRDQESANGRANASGMWSHLQRSQVGHLSGHRFHSWKAEYCTYQGYITFLTDL